MTTASNLLRGALAKEVTRLAEDGLAFLLGKAGSRQALQDS